MTVSVAKCLVLNRPPVCKGVCLINIRVLISLRYVVKCQKIDVALDVYS